MRFILALLLMFFTTPSEALRIEHSPGGHMEKFIGEVYRVAYETQEYVVIDGPCSSACTLYLRLVAFNRLCVTDRAVLRFHQASDTIDGKLIRNRVFTELMLTYYPPPVSAWVDAQGGLQEHWIVLEGEELHKRVPLCSPTKVWRSKLDSERVIR